MGLKSVILACAVLAVAGGRLALAQSFGVEEIVVTGSRLAEYNPTQTPQVTLRKRADNLVTKVTVVCDTRDISQRKAELKATLRNMIRGASKDSSIRLGVGDEVVGAFDDTMLDQVIVPDRKADTSSATVLVKTAVRADDSFDLATGRIKGFVGKPAKDGRTEILLNSGWELTLVNPSQYRPAVAQLVAEDASRMARLFGEGYGVQIEGLQLPVSWYQAGPLDLALYIPYKLTVRPKSP